MLEVVSNLSAENSAKHETGVPLSEREIFREQLR